MTRPMLEANIKIISSLKDFLILVTSNNEYKDLFKMNKVNFTRSRKLPFETLALMIVKLCKKTLSVEIENFFSDLNTNLSCSVPSFCEQRMKLVPMFFYAWNKEFLNSFYQEYGSKVKRWNGLRVLGCDGSNISLINKPKLREYFGGQSNQNNFFVQAKTFYCYDVLNKMILFPQIGSYRNGEMNLAYDVINSGQIQEDMLLIFDRFYSNYKVMALLQWKETEIKYLIRARESIKFVQAFIQSKKLSDVINIYPNSIAIDELKKTALS
jgi:hypothetical protein